MNNLNDGILREYDRLQAVKTAIGEDATKPEFCFYMAGLNGLLNRATDALGGRLDVTEMLALYNEMKEFKE